ncbi:aldo-keto reductase putative [Ophiostoma piceae UAMH 11346]|uniref:Aldo-keto reductase putative n=1 Tax=Ophiostoma piceae (strain UAMH 11346) TaxID=1262450 RepID=S3CVU4_OPHP1|nr:aldo-keto reductase putative [Ophiostoma piceae UAMH 11346]
MSLPTRQLGKDGPRVTSIGIGLMGLSGFYGTRASDDKRLTFLDHVYDSGNRFWDTADMYGDSEDLLGKWFKLHPGRRDDIFLATKFGNTPNGVRSDAAYAHDAVAQSLSRMGIDTIDLYYVHRIDKVTPIEDTMAALARLQATGKIRHIGLCEVSAATLRRAHVVYPVTALQIEYSAFSTDIESTQIGLLSTCRELGIAVVAYSPLGRGMLTGQYRSLDDFDEGDFRRGLPRFSADNFPRNIQLADKLRALAATKGVTAAQLCLAWLLREWDMVIPIPGTKRAACYDENMGALAVELTEDESQEIRAAVDATEVAGARYAAESIPHLIADSPLPNQGETDRILI